MTAATLTLTDFLLARIAEDQEAAGERAFAGWDGQWRSQPSRADVEAVRARDLAECEAKRRIVEATRFDDDPTSAVDLWLDELAAPGRTPPPHIGVMIDTLRALAAIYADHPDYREEWRP